MKHWVVTLYALQDFKGIYQLIGTPNPTEEEIHEVQGKVSIKIINRINLYNRQYSGLGTLSPSDTMATASLM